MKRKKERKKKKKKRRRKKKDLVEKPLGFHAWKGELALNDKPDSKFHELGQHLADETLLVLEDSGLYLHLDVRHLDEAKGDGVHVLWRVGEGHLPIQRRSILSSKRGGGSVEVTLPVISEMTTLTEIGASKEVTAVKINAKSLTQIFTRKV